MSNGKGGEDDCPQRGDKRKGTLAGSESSRSSPLTLELDAKAERFFGGSRSR